jgi:hypothetical protein
MDDPEKAIVGEFQNGRFVALVRSGPNGTPNREVEVLKISWRDPKGQSFLRLGPEDIDSLVQVVTKAREFFQQGQV